MQVCLSNQNFPRPVSAPQSPRVTINRTKGLPAEHFAPKKKSRGKPRPVSSGLSKYHVQSGPPRRRRHYLPRGTFENNATWHSQCTCYESAALAAKDIQGRTSIIVAPHFGFMVRRLPP